MKSGSAPALTIAVLFLIFSVPLFFPLIFTGQLPGPFKAGVSDTSAFFEPFILQFAAMVKASGLPFWDHLSAFGSPSFLPLGNGVSHPFQFLHFILPGPLAFVAGLWARLALFSAFFFLYLRAQKVRTSIALFFTLGLTYGSFFLAYSIEIIGFVVCFFPMALYFADRCCREIKISDFCFLALAVAGVCLGGFPSVIMYLFTCLGLYILCFSRTWKNFLFASLACLCGLFVLWPILYETFTFYPSTGYSNDQRHLLFWYQPPFRSALGLFFPTVYGNNLEHAAAGQRDFYGSRLGFGICAFPLALVFGGYLIFKKKIGRMETFWLLALLVCLICYFGLFHVKNIIQYIPFYNEHPLTRLQCLVAFCGAAAAALVTEKMLREQVAKVAWRNCLLLAAGFVLAALFIALFTQRGARVALYCGGFATVSFIALTALYLVRTKTWAAIAFVGSGIVVAVATSLVYNFYFTPADYFPANALIAHIRDHAVPGAKAVDLGGGGFVLRGRAWGIAEPNAHWFSPRPVMAVAGAPFDQPADVGLTYKTYNHLKHPVDWPALRALHIQFLALGDDQVKSLDGGEGYDWMVAKQNGGISLIEILYDGVRLDNHGLPGSGYQNFTEGGGRIQFLPLRDGWIRLPVRFYPGWRGLENVREVRGANAWLEVLPERAGKPVQLFFRPRHLYKNIFLGLLFAALCLAVGFIISGKASRTT